MSEAIQGHPFGSSSSRFNLNGVHPNLLATGRMPYDKNIENVSKLGPGSYDMLKYQQFSEPNVKLNSSGPNWERSVFIEKISKMPNILNQDAHKKKLENIGKLGPGYYNVEDKSEKPQSIIGYLGTLDKRFKNAYENENPGPGSYGIPDELLEHKRKNKPGNVPLFERSKGSRSLPLVGSDCPPGTYNHQNSIDQLIKKKVSTRGPYDVFSEIRSAPIKTGHYTQDVDKKLGPGEYKSYSFTDMINFREHKKQGKFGKIAQYPVKSGERISINETSLQPRNPDWPGPGYYNITEPGKSSSTENLAPAFLSSSSRSDKLHQKRIYKNYNTVGIGRYNLMEKIPINGSIINTALDFENVINSDKRIKTHKFTEKKV